MDERRWAACALGLVTVLIRSAAAVDHPVVGTKLVILDKVVSAGKAKVAFVAKDGGVVKGAGTDAAQIAATVHVTYDSASGAFDMPQGGNWLVNEDAVAKYVNQTAPVGGGVKVGVIKAGKLVKLAGKSLGDTPLDISSPPSPPAFLADADAYVAYEVVNQGERHRHCTRFLECEHRTIAAGTGFKVVCKGTPLSELYGNAQPDPRCLAAPGCGAERYVDLGVTVRDACTGLEWEKKDGAEDATPGNDTPNPANLHDVDNKYLWAGTCSLVNKLCQPTAAAATCTAQAGNVDGCGTCGVGEGTCNTGGSITIWEWIDQVNAAAFAGHTDWRIPTSAGCSHCGFPTGQGGELESLVDESQGPCNGTGGSCSHPALGPTSVFNYWSASQGHEPIWAWNVRYDDAVQLAYSSPRNGSMHVRAVRAAP